MQPTETILAYLVEGHPRNTSVKLFENWSIGLGVDIFQMFFLYIYLALAAILLFEAERFYLI